MANYLSSDVIKVYPTANRGTNIDSEAYFTSERNITKDSALGFTNKSYIESDGTNLVIVIDGYRFETTVAAVQGLGLGNTTNKVYAGIRRAYGDTTHNTFRHLVQVGTGEEILDSEGNFQGLYFGTSSTLTNCDATVLVLDKNKVATTSLMNISKNQISNGSFSSTDENIATHFSTKRVTSPTFDGNLASCGTSASTQEKTVTLSNFSLVEGAHIFIAFTHTNTATNPTLNVNGTGAKSICLGFNGNYAGKTPDTSWRDAEIVELVYYNLGWIIVGHSKTSTYSRTDKDTSNTLYLVGSTSNSNDAQYSDSLKRDTDISIKGSQMNLGSSIASSAIKVRNQQSSESSATDKFVVEDTGRTTVNSQTDVSNVGESSETYAFKTLGGAIIKKKLYVGSTSTFADVVSITKDTASASSSTGALVVTGGAGIGGALYTGGNIQSTGTITANSGTVTETATLVGTATRAIGDYKGSNIRKTYIYKIASNDASLSGTTWTEAGITYSIRSGDNDTDTNAKKEITTVHKSFCDESGNNIKANYGASLSGGGTSPSIALNSKSGAELSSVTITTTTAEAGTANAARYVYFADSNDDYSGQSATKAKFVYSSSFKYNPSTDVLTVGSITGVAAKSDKIKIGSNYYTVGWDSSSKTLTFTKE